MNPARRREMVDREHPSLPIAGQCALVGVSRSSIYYRPKGASEEDLSLMREMDRQYLATPFYGSRRMKVWLERQAGLFPSQQYLPSRPETAPIVPTSDGIAEH